MRHLPGCMTPQRSPAPWPPVSLAAHFHANLDSDLRLSQSKIPELPGAVERSVLSDTHHMPLPRLSLGKQQHPAQTIPMASCLVPPLAPVKSPCSQDLSVHKAAWLSALQQHSPSPAAPALGGVPTTPCTSQQPLRMNEGASPPLDFAALVARTQPVCWEVSETEPGPQSALTKDPSPCP